MSDYNELFDMAIEAFRKVLYPEEWIRLDMQLSKSELFTLLQVDRNGEIIMSQIADFINIPMSTATGLIERLVKKGYIERMRSESDRRIVAIKLTEEGKKLTGEIKSSISEILSTVLEAFTDEEKKLLKSMITKLAGVFTAGSSEAEAKKEGTVVKKIKIE